MGVQDANRHHLVPYAINQELTQALMPKIVSNVSCRSGGGADVNVGLDGRIVNGEAGCGCTVTDHASDGNHLDLCSPRRRRRHLLVWERAFS